MFRRRCQLYKFSFDFITCCSWNYGTLAHVFNYLPTVFKVVHTSAESTCSTHVQLHLSWCYEATSYSTPVTGGSMAARDSWPSLSQDTWTTTSGLQTAQYIRLYLKKKPWLDHREMDSYLHRWLFPFDPGDMPGQFKVSWWRGGEGGGGGGVPVTSLCSVGSVRSTSRCQRTVGRCEGNTVAVWMIYKVLSGEATLWRAVRGRFRVTELAVRSLLVSDGWVSACGVPASPTSSRRNLNLDRKSCQTTYQPEGERHDTDIYS